MEILNTLLTILAVALGLSVVIVLHELGHFLLAKWNGVKVEAFSLGLGPMVWGLRHGETVYGISAFPLGGYVKMLGEDSDEEKETSADPRAFHNKTVPARMAIISAGVIMNLILGFACFLFVFARGGMPEVPAKIGLVVAGQPAYEAGVRAGDEVVAIDGRRDVTFGDLKRIGALSGAGQVVRLDLKRSGVAEPVSVLVEPRREAGADLPTIGIGPMNGLTLDDPPALWPPGMADRRPADRAGLRPGDQVVAVGPHGEPAEPVDDEYQLDRLLTRYRDRPLDVVVERRAATSSANPGPQRITVTLPPNHFVDLGLRPEMGAVAALKAGGPAEKAGFRRGDRIVKVDGRPVDPMRLPDYCYDRAGKSVTFEVERPSSGGGTEAVTLEATPDDSPIWTEPIIREEPLEVPGLGLAYPVLSRIAAVAEGSPAAEAGLEAGQTIRSLTLSFRDPDAETRGNAKIDKVDRKSETITFTTGGKDDERASWPFAFLRLQVPAWRYPAADPEPTVVLAIEGRKEPVRLTPVPDPEWFHPLRGLRFDPLTRPLPPQGLASAGRHAAQETVEQATAVVAMIRGLIQSRVGRKSVGGPIMIARIAYSFAQSGLTHFIYFLGMISVNLAVLNFLPITPLDGGQMVLLVAEGVRGRPLPESARQWPMLIGIALLLLLMLLVSVQDIFSFFS